MSLGTIKDYTPNFNLIIPEFNISGWHDYLEENFRSIDALFYNLFGINNYSGIWEKLTTYTAGQVVFIGEDTNYSGRLVKVLVNHTTTNDDFTTFFTNNPTYYELFADASTAQYYALQAKDWATKMDGPVEGSNYSAKYYADLVDNLSTEITTLYSIASEIQTVANNVTDINTVASISSNVTSVAGNITNINLVASNNANITTVSQDLVNINTTATNISDINTAASNITAIQNAPTYATNASNSADLAKQYAIGDPTEPTGNSAKYWANQASSELSTLENNVSTIQANYVTTNTAQTITSSKTFTSEQKFKQPSNTTTNGLSIVSYTSGTADIGLRDTSNDWLGRLFFNSSGLLQLSGTSVISVTPTQDNTTSRQIDTVGARNTKINSVLQGLMPSGVILPFGGSSAPTGFLMCDGSAVSRTTYADLFDVIGTTYGSGDGSTTFNLPNLSSGVLPSSSTVDVVGNGNALGIVDDISTEAKQHNALVVGSGSAFSGARIPFSAFNLNAPLAIGSTSTGSQFGTNDKALGVSTLPEWSGLTGSITGVSVNYIIKV